MTNPAIICLVIVGIVVVYASIFALARRETKRRHQCQRLDVYASNVGLERMPNESNEQLARRICDAMRYPSRSGNRCDIFKQETNPTSTRSLMFRGSIYGALILSAIGSLHQDWIGRDAYIQLVQRHWVDARVTVPIAIVALVIGIVAYCIDVIRAHDCRACPKPLRKCQCQWEQGDSPCPLHGENEEEAR